ncbi:putative membrane protein [Candidatus Methanoperedens nitroreducens]|uniref:Putative membrane protein n=1 Tax=Candidatus Methanoperedens nitratireducens TaxID=1392998 RepID=A0A062V3Q5_9EURY|nr:TMEM165/GDT1 family protein [Candidatus Methanoperedens nitroreducens]KCZ71952.1 putative membrane protein [Candidatus Methanoperedens nitroreducens]MDJ1422071.1 TMEM165/GDT1 family protein [Candidatus Methanoperedens sp.]
MDITPLLTTFGLIAVAEFGDKTQLIVVALSARYDRLRVFAGVILAFALITGLGILVGKTLLQLIDPALIRIIAGLFFLVFGIWTLLPEKENDADDNVPLGNPLVSTFSMIALAEMGDKTQLSVIALSARYDSPYLVFIGAVLALGLISLIGILIGKKLTGIVPLPKIKLGAGIMFILFGILFLAGF